MNPITDLEIGSKPDGLGAGEGLVDVDKFLCHLPVGSAITAYAVISNSLDGAIFRNGLRLLREELLLKTAAITKEVANLIKGGLVGRGIDQTRMGIICSILDYLQGKAEAVVDILDLLVGENIVSEQTALELKFLHCA